MNGPDEWKEVLSLVRREISQQLGTDVIAELHQSKPLLDVLAVLLIPGVFLTLAIYLSRNSIGPFWLLALVMQGLILHIFGLLCHDLFTHRQVGGRKLAYMASLLFMLPLGITPTGYRKSHWEHHRYLNSELDSELYKHDLDARWKRLAYMTFVGALLAHARAFANGDHELSDVRSGVNKPHARTNLIAARQIRIERYTLLVYGALLIALTLAKYPMVIYGYLLPLLLITPIVNALRISLEHSEADPDNPIQAAMFYRTGIISRLVFFFDSGDCHLIHHLYPNIPYYSIPRAVQLMRSYLIKHGVNEHRSLSFVLKGFFVHAFVYGLPWSRSSSTTSTRPV